MQYGDYLFIFVGCFFWNVFVRESQVGLTSLFVEFGNFFYYLITDYISSVHSFSLNYPFFYALYQFEKGLSPAYLSRSQIICALPKTESK